MTTLTALRCANCGLAYLGVTIEHLLLATSGASCPSCRSPLTEERPGMAGEQRPRLTRRRRLSPPMARRVTGRDGPRPQAS